MRNGINLNTVICKNCALVYSNPVPAEQLYYRFYTDAYNNYYQTEPQLVVPEKCPPWIQAKLDLVQSYLPDSNSTILEVGAGNGYFLYWLQKKFPHALGIEPGPNISYSIEKYGLNAQQGFFDNHPFQERSFKMILMIHVFEHFYEPNIILEKCHALLEDEGYLFIEIPNIHRPFMSLDNYFLRYVHLINYAEDTIETLLHKHHFKVKYISTKRNTRNSPYNLFVVAQKSSVQSIQTKKVSYKETIKILCAYRIKWYLYRKHLRFIVMAYYKTKKTVKKLLLLTSFGKWLKKISR